MAGKRGPKISPTVENLIAFRSIKNLGMPRRALAVELKDEINHLGEIPPSEETLLRKISSYRVENEKKQKPDPETGEVSIDTPWQLKNTLDLPADAISAIFSVKRWWDEYREGGRFRFDIELNYSFSDWGDNVTEKEIPISGTELTIREALWISRLHKVKSSPKGKDNEILNIDDPRDFFCIIKAYSDYQRMCELTGVEFDTSEMDEALMNGEDIQKVKLSSFPFKDEQRYIDYGWEIKKGEENERTHKTEE